LGDAGAGRDARGSRPGSRPRWKREPAARPSPRAVEQPPATRHPGRWRSWAAALARGRWSGCMPPWNVIVTVSWP